MCRRNGRPGCLLGPSPRACGGERHVDFPQLATGKPSGILPNGRASLSRGSRYEILCARVNTPPGDYVSTTQLRFLPHEQSCPTHGDFRYIITWYNNFIYDTARLCPFSLLPMISRNNYHRHDLFPSIELFFTIIFCLLKKYFSELSLRKKFKGYGKIPNLR